MIESSMNPLGIREEQRAQDSGDSPLSIGSRLGRFFGQQLGSRTLVPRALILLPVFQVESETYQHNASKLAWMQSHQRDNGRYGLNNRAKLLSDV
jgi:hypothetical protein